MVFDIKFRPGLGNESCGLTPADLLLDRLPLRPLPEDLLGGGLRLCTLARKICLDALAFDELHVSILE